MPWRARADVGFSLSALVLSAAIVVSCVSVTPSTAPRTSASVTEQATLLATPSSPTEIPVDARARPSDAPERPLATPTAVPTEPATPQPTPPSSVTAVGPAGLAGPIRDDVGAVSASESVGPTTPHVSAAPLVVPTGGVPSSSVPADAAPPLVDMATASGASPTADLTDPAASSWPTLPASPEPRHDASAPSSGLDRRTVRRIERIIKRTTSRKGVAGLQVAVRLADGRTWLGTAGSAAFSPQRPVRDDTVFSIASVSKTFIAALILDLAQEGKLDLDAPYGRYVDDGPRRDRVTIRQLLSHTSGIYDYFENPRYQRAATAWLRTRPQPGQLARDHQWTYDEIMALVKPAAYCKPGRCYRYSNTNYILLGHVAETVGGMPLDRLLRRRFFRPLGLDDTYFQPAEQPPASAAHGHWPNGAGFTDHTRDDPLRPFTAAVTVAGAAGAIASTARDLAVWAQALYGGKVLSRSSVAALTDIQPEGTYGLGTDYAVFAGHRAYGHRGGLRGFEASMWFFPDEGVSIVLLSNEGNWFLSRARSIDIPMEGIVRAVLGKRR